MTSEEAQSAAQEFIQGLVNLAGNEGRMRGLPAVIFEGFKVESITLYRGRAEGIVTTDHGRFFEVSAYYRGE